MANIDDVWRLGATLRPYRNRIQAQLSNPDGALNSSDDGFDFPPTLHPVRELVTFSIFVPGIIALIVWGGSKLF